MLKRFIHKCLQKLGHILLILLDRLIFRYLRMLGHGIRNTIEKYLDWRRNTPFKCRRRVRICIYGLFGGSVFATTPDNSTAVIGLIVLGITIFELVDTFEDIKICREIPECYAIMDVRDIDREGK